MPTQNRREILKKTGYAVGASSLLAGCTGTDSQSNPSTTDGGNTPSSSTPSSPETHTLDVAVPSSDATDVQAWYGMREVANQQYNTEVTAHVLGNTSLMLQSTLSGQTAGARDSPTAVMPLIAQGKPMKYIFTDTGSTDYVLVGRPEYESLEDVIEKDAKVGNASKNIGGLTSLQMIGVMFENNVIDNYEDLTEQYVAVGYSSARMQALLRGDIDVSPQHYTQWLQIKKENPEYNLISTFAKDLTKWATYGFYAPPQSIEQNADAWVGLMKGIMTSIGELYNDFELYKQMVRKYVSGGGPEEDVLRSSWEFFKENDFWPPDGDTQEAKIQFMADLFHRTGVLKTELSYDQIVDRSLLDRALSEME